VADKIFLLAAVGTLIGVMAGPAARIVLAGTLIGEGYLLTKRVVDYQTGRRSYPPMALGRPKVWLQAIAIGALVAAQLGAPAPLATAGTLLLAATLPLVALSIHAKRARRPGSAQR